MDYQYLQQFWQENSKDKDKEECLNFFLSFD